VRGRWGGRIDFGGVAGLSWSAEARTPSRPHTRVRVRGPGRRANELAVPMGGGWHADRPRALRAHARAYAREGPVGRVIERIAFAPLGLKAHARSVRSRARAYIRNRLARHQRALKRHRRWSRRGGPSRGRAG
jgi:hypothetical protein